MTTPETTAKAGNLPERLDKIGTAFLWGVRVVGPDDLRPAKGYAHAVALAADHNANSVDVMETTGVASIAIPTIWPWSEKDHRAALDAGEGSHP